MSNIIQLNFANRSQSDHDFVNVLGECVVNKRRIFGDVYWLKENAEFLNILETTGAYSNSFDLSIYDQFYSSVERQMSFFPQYYRFFLELALDLDALGMTKNKGAQLAQWVHDADLIQGELSDLQRGETMRLLARADIKTGQSDAIEERLRTYMDHSATFALPNKKASYELTHLVFYLSEYGRKDPVLSPDAKTSLEYVGLLAVLDMNADLLSEVCVAMRFAGMSPPQEWDQWIADMRSQFRVSATPDDRDDYHQFMMMQWSHMIATGQGFQGPFDAQVHSFIPPLHYVSPLRQMSETLFSMETARSEDWDKMRGHVSVDLTEQAYEILEMAERTSPKFHDFFGYFARCHPVLTAAS